MILDYIIIHQTFAYLIIFVGMMIEGDILLFTAGFLANRGFFDVITLLVIVFSGVILGDNLWYIFGEVIKKESWFNKFIERITLPFDEHLKNRTVRTIFIAKFTYGFYRPVLLRAGSQNLSFKKFIKADVFASIVWIFLIGGLGYISSASFFIIRQYLRYTELTLFLGIAIFILISHVITRISKKEL